MQKSILKVLEIIQDTYYEGQKLAVKSTSMQQFLNDYTHMIVDNIKQQFDNTENQNENPESTARTTD